MLSRSLDGSHGEGMSEPLRRPKGGVVTIDEEGLRMNGRYVVNLFAFALAASAILMPESAQAKENYFSAYCSSCHTNDNTTCNGCHRHGMPVLSANVQTVQSETDSTPKSQYLPGETVVVRYEGGSFNGGWIRANLYDENGSEILAARVTGPTGMGDDGTADPDLEFPVHLSAPAPLTPGIYQWSVTWYGALEAHTNPDHGESAQIATNFFEVVAPSDELTSIALNSPGLADQIASAPTFVWTPDGGTNNIYAVQLVIAYQGSTYPWSTLTALGPLQATSWTMPDTLWNLIPPGSIIYWLVKGADLDLQPIQIVQSSPSGFYKVP